MNQKGFGRLEVIGFLAIVALSLLIVWILVGQLEESRIPSSGGSGQIILPSSSGNSVPVSSELDVGTYSDLESKIAEKSMDYFMANQTDETQVVTIAKLVQNSYIPQVYSLKNHNVICTGYVEYHRNTDRALTYLKCDDEYQTDGYNALNDY